MIGRHAAHVDETKLDERTIAAANAFMTQLRSLCFKTAAADIEIADLEVTLKDCNNNRPVGWISFDGNALTFTPTEA